MSEIERLLTENPMPFRQASRMVWHLQMVMDTSAEVESFCASENFSSNGQSQGPMALVEEPADQEEDRFDWSPLHSHAVKLFDKLECAGINKQEMAKFMKSLRLFDYLPPNYQRALGG